MTETRTEFLKKLPSREKIADVLGFKPEKILVIHDKRLTRAAPLNKWLGEFALRYPVTAGEELKDLADFAGHVRKVTKILGPFSPRSLALVAVGGGSVGDFAGFLASVLKRGVPLVNVPSTLLAAMDSAHGGKTALNVGGVKNQIGTFYPAAGVLIARALFEDLPELQLRSAAGELLKMALIEGGELFARANASFEPTLDAIWDALPAAIEAKNKIVAKDPLERGGERQILNLGHTLGHALESHYGLPHGIAVGHGLTFAVAWSAHQGYLRDPQPLLEFLKERGGFGGPSGLGLRRISRAKLARLITEDKKLTDARHVTFVFLEGAGRPFRKTVTLESFLTETQRQGWTAL